MSSNQYAAHFVPLESSPEIFNFLIDGLGASSNLRFREVYTLDEPNQLPHPALALILIFPTSTTYERHKVVEEATAHENTHDDGEVVWFKQTINNACGLYAILHAICNSDGKRFIERESFLSNLIHTEPQHRTSVLEGSEELKFLYAEAAKRGTTEAPNPEEEVDFHYVCFAKPSISSFIYELDGDRKGPIARGKPISPEHDMLTGAGLQILKAAIDRENDLDGHFSLMALTLAENIGTHDFGLSGTCDL